MTNELILEIQLSAGSDAMTTFQQWVRLLLSAGTLLVGTAASAAVLGPGQTLAPGQRLYSADNAYFAALSADGDFSVYRSADGARAWSTGTRGSRAVIATMLRDGQFVLLTSDGNTCVGAPHPRATSDLRCNGLGNRHGHQRSEMEAAKEERRAYR